jgi:hypothetical protein
MNWACMTIELRDFFNEKLCLIFISKSHIDCCTPLCCSFARKFDKKRLSNVPYRVLCLVLGYLLSQTLSQILYAHDWTIFTVEAIAFDSCFFFALVTVTLEHPFRIQFCYFSLYQSRLFLSSEPISFKHHSKGTNLPLHWDKVFINHIYELI